MTIKKLDNQIIYYENVLINSVDFIEFIEKHDNISNNMYHLSRWKPWNSSDNAKQYGYHKDGAFFNHQANTESDIETSLAIGQIKNISEICFMNYQKNTGIKDLKLPNYFSIKKYNPGSDMGAHVDSEDPSDITHPIISGVIYLNDDYEGGELYFPEQNIKLKPSAGSMVIFPSFRPYFHHPMKVISGNKYMIALFWYDLKTVWS
jgi:predicted 2-oxoglutarate/Fe(II)-dependent dioxygenase YbiX